MVALAGGGHVRLQHRCCHDNAHVRGCIFGHKHKHAGATRDTRGEMPLTYPCESGLGI